MESFPQDMNLPKESDDGCIFGGKLESCKKLNCNASSSGDALKPAKQQTIEVSEAQPFRRIDMNLPKTSDDGCIFGGKLESCKELNCNPSSARDALKPAKQPTIEVSEAQPIRRVYKTNMSNANGSLQKEMAAIQKSSYVISPDTYKTLLENLYMARLWLLRARNITMNQLGVYEEEAIEHMQEIKRIVQEELENPEASAEFLAQELVQVSTDVIRKQQALNRIAMEELLKYLDGLLNTLRSDVKEVKGLAEPEYEEESEQRSFADLVFDYGHWCLFVMYVSIVLIMGLFHYLPAFEEYL